MTYAIIGALDAEVEKIRSRMTVEKQTDLFGTQFFEGTVYGKNIVLVCCGVGTINAALYANAAIREFGADAVINIGVAGAMDPRLHVLDVVISKELVFHDADNTILKQFYPFQEFYQANPRLVELCRAACETVLGSGRFYEGRIATGDVFVKDNIKKQEIMDKYQPFCVEMEGAAIAHAAVVNDKPFLVVRTMSDSADDNADDTYDNWLSDAADHSANIILNMLQNAE